MPVNLYIFNQYGCTASIYGIGTYIRELLAAVRHNDLNVCVIHLLSDKLQMQIENADGIQQWYVPDLKTSNIILNGDSQRKLYYRSIVYLLRLYVKDTSKLVFHVNFMQDDLLIKELRRLFKCRIVFTIHYFNWCFSLLGNMTQFRNLVMQQKGSQPDGPDIKKELENEKEFFSTADRVICLSKQTLSILEADYLLAADRLQVIYNGLSDSKAALPDKSSLLAKYQLTNDIPIILFTGRLDEVKGLQYVVQAFKAIQKKFPKNRLIVVGNGMFDKYLKECRYIWANVTFTGHLDKEQLYELYAIADIGVMPSFHEQCSYVAIEMMMHGLPIVGSTTTGLKEMIVDGETGLHVPVVEYEDRVDMDTDLLAEKMLYLLQNPQERKRMGRNARKRYEALYTAERMGRQMVALYKSLWDGSSAPENL